MRSTTLAGRLKKSSWQWRFTTRTPASSRGSIRLFELRQAGCDYACWNITPRRETRNRSSSKYRVGVAFRAFEALSGFAMSRLDPAKRFGSRRQLPLGRHLGLAQQARLADPLRQRRLQLRDPRGLLLFQQEPPLQFDIRRSEWFDVVFAQPSSGDRH